jgi:hypothetical protein
MHFLRRQKVGFASGLTVNVETDEGNAQRGWRGRPVFPVQLSRQRNPATGIGSVDADGQWGRSNRLAEKAYFSDRI